MKRMIKTAVVALALLALLSISPLASASPPPFIDEDGGYCTWVQNADFGGTIGVVGIYGCFNSITRIWYISDGPACTNP
ncbi:MAG: hypothetical protein AAGD01_05155 [Acidobacteriota bacterium]